MITYEVQGRRTTRDQQGRVREVVRLRSATSRDAAFEIADTMVADDLTAWVFKAERRMGKTAYTLLGVLPQSA